MLQLVLAGGAYILAYLQNREIDDPAGSRSIGEMVQTFLHSSIAHADGYNEHFGVHGTWDAVGIAVVGTLFLWCMLGALISPLICRSRAPREQLLALGVVQAGATMLGSLLLSYIAHVGWGAPYPRMRTGLYLVPLFTLTTAMILVMPARLWPRFSALHLPMFAGILLLVQYVAQLGVTPYYEFEHDFGTGLSFRAIMNEADRSGREHTDVRIDQGMEAAQDFYRRMFGRREIRFWNWDGSKASPGRNYRQSSIALADFDIIVFLKILENSDLSTRPPMSEPMYARELYRDETSRPDRYGRPSVVVAVTDIIAPR